MKTIILLIILLTSGTNLLAQNKEEPTAKRPRNNVNLNLVGNASLISINYERLLLIKPIFFLSGELGIGYNTTVSFNFFGAFGAEESGSTNHLTIPHHITGNLGKGRHFFEFGLGGTIITGGLHNYILYPIIGYRLQPLRSKKVNFRLFGSYPIYGKDVEDTLDIIFSPVGLSLGVCF
jgi:hypothetical protein